MRNMLGKRSLG